MKLAASRVMGLFVCCCVIMPLMARADAMHAGDTVKVNVTVIIASNEGNDYNMDNDEFRDRLIKLFSYTNYEQVNSEALQLKRAERVKMTLPDGYELWLTLQNHEEDRILIQAVVMKNGTQFVDTILSVLTPGVAFLGGPPLSEGTLIIVLENGF